jgi:uncharacterized protein (TIGR03086 family)
VTAGGVDLLERAVTYTLGCLHAVPPEALDWPTPCRGWDLRALLAHVNDSLLALREAAELGQVYLDPVDIDGDPVRTARDRAQLLLGAWSNHAGRAGVSVADLELTTGVLTSAGAVEVAVHGWDVARTLGRDRPIPVPLAEEMLALSPLLVSDLDRPSRFAPPIPVPRGAPPGDRLIAFLGRHP